MHLCQWWLNLLSETISRIRRLRGREGDGSSNDSKLVRFKTRAKNEILSFVATTMDGAKRGYVKKKKKTTN